MKRRFFAVNCGALVVASLAAAVTIGSPTGGWLARGQLKFLAAVPLAMAGGAAIPDTKAQNRAIAAANPTDAGLARANASTPGERSAVTSAFPNDPGARADILRFDAPKRASGNNRAENFGEKGTPKNWFEKTPDPKIVAELLEHARAGERLEPGNAFFPTMAANILLSAHRDDEALDALSRAARGSGWDEHISDVVLAKFRLAEARQGRTPALALLAIAAAELYPHYAELRATARVAVALADRKQASGDTAGALEIRADVVAIGARMRNDSTTLIGNLVGLAIHSIGTTTPDARKTTRDSIRKPGESDVAATARVVTIRDDAWSKFARENGRPELADAARENTAFRQAIQNQMSEASEKNAMDLPRQLRALGLQAIGGLLLLSAAWTLFLGAIFVGLSKTGRIRANLPMHPGVRAGLILMLLTLPSLITAMALVRAGSGDGESMSRGPIIGAIVAWGVFTASALVAVLPLVFARGLSVPKKLGALALTVIATGLVLGANLPTVAGIVAAYGATGGVSSTEIASVSWIGGAVLLVPALLLSALALVGRLKRIPAQVAMVRYFPELALPLAAALVLGWAILVPIAARFDDTLRADMEKSIRHEGRYILNLNGKSWPDEKKRDDAN